MKVDVIGAVESCYASAGADDAWLSGMLDALVPLARGSGMMGQVFRFLEDGSMIVESRVQRDFPPGLMAESDRLIRSTPTDIIRRHWAPSPPVDYAKRRAALAAPPVLAFLQDLFQRHGCENQLGLFAAEPNGRTVGIFINVPLGSALLPSRIVHRLKSVAAHLTSGLRLRLMLAPEEEPPRDAVLDPGGRVLDATGPATKRTARESLSEAVRRREKARGRLRLVDPDEALTLWQGLVDGTWSLIDQHESDGKRYLLARRNAPGGLDPTALAPGERAVLAYAAMGHSNKYIAYLLGLPASLVASRLAHAKRKLGVASRAELILRFAPFLQQGTPSPERASGPPLRVTSP